MATYRNQNQNQKRYRTNQYITANEVRLIDEDAKQIGVMNMTEARKMAFESGLDLVEIAPLAKPPVVKLIEFAKFKYQESKKLKAEKRGIKGGGMKEIQTTPFVSQNDYETALNKAKRFLSSGNKVKFSIKFQGREIQHPEFGHQLVSRLKTDLTDLAILEGDAKLMGKKLYATFTVVNKAKSN
jgi:translation initiation factor IF-3